MPQTFVVQEAPVQTIEVIYRDSDVHVAEFTPIQSSTVQIFSAGTMSVYVLEPQAHVIIA